MVDLLVVQSAAQMVAQSAVLTVDLKAVRKACWWVLRLGILLGDLTVGRSAALSAALSAPQKVD